MFFSFFNFKSLYDYLGNHKDLPNRSQNSVLFWNTLRKVSKVSAGQTKTLRYFLVTGRKRNNLSLFFSLMLYDLWSLFLSTKKPPRASELVYLLWWKSTGLLRPVLFHSSVFPSWSSNIFYLTLSMVRDAVYTGFLHLLHLLWPLMCFISFDVDRTIIKSIFSVAHKMWFHNW